MDLSLIGKRAIVCGSTDGIGKASALLMSERGATVTLIARNEQKLTNTLNELSAKHGQNHSTICVDFNKPDKLKKIFYKYLNKNSYTQDILVNNSGGPHGGNLIDAEEDEFRLAFERLLICNHILVKAVVPGMKKFGSGRIINITSMSVNQVIPGLGVSNTIRGAVAQWAKTLALELGQFGITVNNILPGYTATSRLQDLAESKAKSSGNSVKQINKSWTENIALKRLGKPEEIASAIAFLASDSASFINGHNLTLDGGRISG